MKTAIMQPYFFPYIGYLQLVACADHFVLLDDVQYIRHGWINRNRMLKPGGGWQYITVPLQSHGRDILIRDVMCKNGRDWKDLILRQIEHYRKRAPFYESTRRVIEEGLAAEERSVCLLNRRCLESVCRYLHLSTPISVSSEMKLDYAGVSGAGDWALEISKQLGADTYINPVNGRDLFDPATYAKAGITLHFQSHPSFTYSQRNPAPFEADLSILDVMMWNEPEAIRNVLMDIRFE